MNNRKFLAVIISISIMILMAGCGHSAQAPATKDVASKAVSGTPAQKAVIPNNPDFTIGSTATQNNVLGRYRGAGGKVVIPEGITSISGCAFTGCTSLTSVTIPNSVTSIEDQAFFGCTSLTSITIPKSVTSIGDQAIDGGKQLTISCYNNPYIIDYLKTHGIPYKIIQK